MKKTTDIAICFLRARHPRAIHSRMGRGNLRWRLVAALALTLAAALSLVVACGSDESLGPESCTGPACDGGVDSSTTDGAPGMDTGVTDGGGGADVVVADASDGSSACPGPAGTLDSTFGDGGIVWLKYPSSGAYAVAAQPDGKIIVGGYTGGSGGSFAVVRLLASGVPDPAFGTTGLVETKVGDVNLEVHAVAVQPDGRIVAAGFSRPTAGSFQFVVLRYMSNGAPDTAFGTDGVVMTSYPGRQAYAQSLVLLPSGKIVVAGYSEDATASGANFEMIRYASDGSPDPTFGTAGRVTVDARGTDDRVGALALAPGGALVLAGSTKETPSLAGRYDMFATRVKDDGAIDPTFAVSGKFISAFGSGTQRASGVAVDGTGRVLLGGWFGGAAPDDFGVLRLTAAGALDPVFGEAGAAKTDFGGRGDRSVQLLLQDDGRIVALGTSGVGAQSDTYGTSFARYLPSGVTDPTFGTGGTTFIPPASNAQAGASGGALAGCSILAVGTWIYDLNAVSDTAIGVVRLRR